MIGCIYRINVGDYGFYIGSAKNFNERLSHHQTTSKIAYFKIYNAIRDNGGEFVMIKLHDFEYETDEELRIEERRVFDALSPNLNTYRPHITEEEKRERIKQYNIDNADKIREQKKQWFIDNADKTKERKKQYRIENADKIKAFHKQYRIDNSDKLKEQKKQWSIENAVILKEKRKQYNIDNADKIKERQKQYKIDNADKIKERQKQYKMDNREQHNKKITCEYGCEVNNRYLSQHIKTQKHINMMIGK